MSYDDDKTAREALRELDPFLMMIRQNGASAEDVPALAGVAVASALLALVGEVRMLRSEAQARFELERYSTE